MRRLVPLLALLGALAFPGVASAGPLTWSGATNLSASGLTAVSCPTTSLCVAADSAPFSNILWSTNPTGGAAAWTSDVVGQNNFQSINGISCPTTTLCVAVDSVGWVYWSTDPVGGVWSDTGGSVNGAGGLRAISCASTSLCVAAGSNGNIVWSTNPTGGLGAWTQANVSGANLVLSISCPTTSLCLAGDDAGNILSSPNPTGGALQWSSATAVAADIIRGMACAAPTLCVAADDGGNVLVATNPTGGVPAWQTSNVSANFVPAVSCAAATLCVAGDSGGGLIESINPTGSSADWSRTAIGTSMNDISCPTTELCVAVASGGNAYFGRQGGLTVSLAGGGSGSVTGPGIACPPTCGRAYPGGTQVTLTAAPAADGSTFVGWSGACTGTGDCALTMNSNRAVTASFTGPPAAPAASDPVPAPTATPAQTSPLPPPVVAQSANVIPVKPGVLVRVRGSTRFVPLATPEQIQFGSVIDARRGRVRLVIANGKGGTDAADFFGGVFRIGQKSGRVPIGELTLVGGSFRSCPKTASRQAQLSARRRTQGKSVRKLWGDGKGSFRTKGRYATATIRGTRWLTDDRCNGTLARVTVGAITVRDLTKRRNVVVRAPRSYFARPR